jgi:hypothetical protein
MWQLRTWRSEGKGEESRMTPKIHANKFISKKKKKGYQNWEGLDIDQIKLLIPEMRQRRQKESSLV